MNRRLSTQVRVIAVALAALLAGIVFGVAYTNEQRNFALSGGYRTTSLTYLVYLAILVLLVAVVVVLARLTLRPLTDRLSGMADAVRQLGPQNMGHRLGRGTEHDPELGGLIGAVDAMLDRVAAGFEGQRRFASNASHELRTPLAVQRTLIEVALATSAPDADLQRLGAELLLVNDRNEHLIEGLLVLAESDRGLPGVVPVALDELVADVLAVHEDLARRHDVRLDGHLAPRTVSGDPLLLERLIGNLVHNGIKYNEPGGVVEVTVADQPALTVRNTGQTVPAEVVPSLFEPFRRLAAQRTHQRDGAGLGLSIVRSIAAAHRGLVTATPGETGGLSVEVRLPPTS